MSFTVNNSTGTTLYILPDISGSANTFLRTGGAGTTCTWSAIIIPPNRIYGEIVMWNGNINTVSPLQPIDDNNNVLADWYVCNATTPNGNLNMTDRVMLGVEGEVTLSRGGDYPLTTIKYGRHTHGHSIVGSLGSTTNNAGAHAHDITARVTATQGWGGNFSDYQGHRHHGTGRDHSRAKKRCGTSISASTYGSVEAGSGGDHSHSFQCTLVDAGDMPSQQTQSQSQSQSSHIAHIYVHIRKIQIQVGSLWPFAILSPSSAGLISHLSAHRRDRRGCYCHWTCHWTTTATPDEDAQGFRRGIPGCRSTSRNRQRARRSRR